jgi:hypothetical protein
MARQDNARSPSSERRPSIDKEGDVSVLEQAQISNEQVWIQEFDLLNTKTPEELAALNKKVLKKLDWRFLTTITAMLLMK